VIVQDFFTALAVFLQCVPDAVERLAVCSGPLKNARALPDCLIVRIAADVSERLVYIDDSRARGIYGIYLGNDDHLINAFQQGV